MWWCSNTESVPLLVSNTHDIILVRTEYVLVCTSLYDYTFPVLVCTWYVLVRTVSLSVRTKYPGPDLVRPVTIPDAEDCTNNTFYEHADPLIGIVLLNSLCIKLLNESNFNRHQPTPQAAYISLLRRNASSFTACWQSEMRLQNVV